MVDTPNKIVKNYIFNCCEPIGRGQYWTVYLAKNLTDKKLYALKVLAVKELKGRSNSFEIISNEFETLRYLQDVRSPHIVHLVEFFSTQKYLYIVTQYCNGGDLQKVLTNGPLPESTVMDYLKQLVSGYKELYKKKVMHRDLKLQNLMLHDGVLKISDFGFSKMFERCSQPMQHSIKGTPLTMSPQVFRGEAYTEKCDVWSLGVMLFELLYNRLAWTTSEGMGVYFQEIVKTPLQFPPDSEVKVSEWMKNFITKCLKRDENDRISWPEIFALPEFEEHSPVSTSDPISPDTASKKKKEDSKDGSIRSWNIEEISSTEGEMRTGRARTVNGTPDLLSPGIANNGLRGKPQTSRFVYINNEDEDDLPQEPKIFGRVVGHFQSEREIRNHEDSNNAGEEHKAETPTSKPYKAESLVDDDNNKSIRTMPPLRKSGDNFDSTQLTNIEGNSNVLLFSDPVARTLVLENYALFSAGHSKELSVELQDCISNISQAHSQAQSVHDLQFFDMANTKLDTSFDAAAFVANVDIVNTLCMYSGEASYHLSSNEAIFKKHGIWPKSVELNLYLILQRMCMTSRYLTMFEEYKHALKEDDLKKVTKTMSMIRTNAQVYKKYLTTFMKDKVDLLLTSSNCPISADLIKNTKMELKSNNVMSVCPMVSREILVKTASEFVDDLMTVTKKEEAELMSKSIIATKATDMKVPTGTTKNAATKERTVMKPFEKLKDFVVLADFLVDTMIFYSKTPEILRCEYLPYLHDLLMVTATSKAMIKEHHNLSGSLGNLSVKKKRVLERLTDLAVHGH